MKKVFTILICFAAISFSQAQTILRVLFIGNSYTYVNDLPGLVSLVAKSAGDSLVYSSSAPGGYTLQQHCSNATTNSLIQQGNWDFVVLQEQSQLPSFTDGEVQSMVFPYATQLDNMIRQADSCAETIFYMTWGRKNGDATNCAVWPPVCTYEGMDSLLHLRYMMMAQDNDAEVSPVGAVWHYLRTNAPGIELYSADESHPSPAGSYAAACTFYASMYRKDPSHITYDFSLSAADANTIRQAAKTIVFDNLANWYNTDEIPLAMFTHSNSTTPVQFVNSSTNALEYFWDFGDGTNSTEENPTHYFPYDGMYTIALIASACGHSDTTSETFWVATLGIESAEYSIRFFPNPVHDFLSVSAGAKILRVSICDVAGRRFINESGPESNEISINTQSLRPGVYFLTVETINEYFVRKIAVEIK
ncbi:hypothetical protein SDC9_77014 [bioreactor metagenome]|uniref:PKD domain-containing protein n=1 Tax=bioreactor metagenome TaxID=1076179 RepID=A0A644YWS9_9ZZZZ